MAKMVKIGIAMAMLLAMSVGASAAQAATYRFSTTSSSLTATGPATRLVTAGATLTCSTSGALLTGPAAGTYTGPASTGAWNHVAQPASTVIAVTPRFSSCRIGATAYTVKCNADEPTPVAGAYLNANSTTETSQFDTTHSTLGTLSGIDCNVYVGNGTTSFCTKITSTGAAVSGFTDRVGVSGSYVNPSSSTTGGTLTISAAGQSLTSNTSGSGCILGNGDARFSNSTGGDVPFAVAASASLWAS